MAVRCTEESIWNIQACLESSDSLYFICRQSVKLGCVQCSRITQLFIIYLTLLYDDFLVRVTSVTLLRGKWKKINSHCQKGSETTPEKISIFGNLRRASVQCGMMDNKMYMTFEWFLMYCISVFFNCLNLFYLLLIFLFPVF